MRYTIRLLAMKATVGYRPYFSLPKRASNETSRPLFVSRVFLRTGKQCVRVAHMTDVDHVLQNSLRRRTCHRGMWKVITYRNRYDCVGVRTAASQPVANHLRPHGLHCRHQAEEGDVTCAPTGHDRQNQIAHHTLLSAHPFT